MKLPHHPARRIPPETSAFTAIETPTSITTPTLRTGSVEPGHKVLKAQFALPPFAFAEAGRALREGLQ